MEQSQHLAARAYLAGLHGWTPIRVDAHLGVAVRIDAARSGKRRCVRGTACGNSCIAPGKTCRIKGNPQKLGRLKQLLALPAAGQTSGQGPGGARPKAATGGLSTEESIAMEVMSNKKLRSDKARVAEMIRRGIPANTDFVKLVSEARVKFAKDFVRRAEAGEKVFPEKPRFQPVAELRTAVFKAFKVSNEKELKSDRLFRATYFKGKKAPDFKSRGTWLQLYREHVGVPLAEQNLPDGPTVIRGVDVTKNFRPWHVFNLDPNTATTNDVNKAFRTLAKKHHPDYGGNRETFERLKKMRDTLVALMPDLPSSRNKG